MIWVIIFVVIGVVMFFAFVFALPEEKNQKSKKKPLVKTNLPTVSELVNSVENLDDIKKLKQKYYNAERSYMNNTSDNPTIEKRYRIYEDAYWKATEKTLFYQFEPMLELNTPNSFLENAFKIVPISEYINLRKKIGGNDNDWVELSASDIEDKNYESKPTYFDALIEYQNIIAQPYSFEIKLEKLNEFGKRKRAFKKEFFYGEKEPLGVLWTKELFSSFKVPLIDKLYDLGYTTPEKLVKINLDEVTKIKGFGNEKLEDLKAAIEKIKADKTLYKKPETT